MSSVSKSVPEYATYTAPEFRDEFVADMERPSPLAQLSQDGIVRLSYDPAAYDVRALVGDALAAAGMIDRRELTRRGDCLEWLHELVAPEHQAMDRSQQSAAARVLYEMPTAFAAVYERLLTDVVVPALGLGPVYLQRTPTFRVFFPNAPGYPGATSYHSDIMIGHNPREVNVFVPLVRTEGTRSLLMANLADSLQVLREYDYDFGRFGSDTQESASLQERLGRLCQPLRCEVGDVVVFDSRCVHAGPHNKTPLTRVTFDARILPDAEVRAQKNAYRGLGRRRADFAIGQYFTAHAVG